MKLFIIYLAIGAAILINAFGAAYASPTNTLDGFVLKYKMAKTEIQKRTVAIDLIDAGLLYYGSPIDDVKKVFLGDFEECGADSVNTRRAIVHFVPPKHSSEPMASAVWTGWYLSLTYREDGSVLRYYLSNENKTRSTQPMDQGQTKEGPSNLLNDVPVLIIVTNINSSVNTNK